MRALRWPGVVLLLFLLAGGGLRAEEEPAAGDDARAEAVTELVGLLRLRIEARLKEGEALSRAGRLDEALAVFRSVETMYAEGLKEIRALMDRFDGRPGAAGSPAARPRPRQPVVEDEKIEETPEEQGRGWEEIGGSGGGFRGRSGSRERSNGSPPKKFDDAVDDALRWLAAHQSPYGSWEAHGFDRWCEGKPAPDARRMPDGRGKAIYDVGVTGLALCAFLGAGYTHRGKHPFAKVVSRGLRYLKNVQDPEGCFGPRSTQQYIYNHATAALAMVEAYGMTGSPIFKGSAQRCLDFIALARNPYFAWRYGIKPGDNDTSVSGWMLMGLKSAQIINRAAVQAGRAAPLAIDESAFEGMKAWLGKVTDFDYGRVGYWSRGTGPARPMELVDRFPGDKSESMTAVGVLSRILMGEDPRRSRACKLGADLMARLPPTWNPSDGSVDMYYWYYGTLAMFQVGGKHWRTWMKGLEQAVVRTQRGDTDYCGYKGSWDPIGPWGLDGGRVYSTALMALCCEVFYRYERVFGPR